MFTMSVFKDNLSNAFILKNILSYISLKDELSYLSLDCYTVGIQTKMEITDIILESHIVSEGTLTKEQEKEIEQLLENATEVNLEQIAQVLEKGGHKVFQKHAHSMQVGNFNSQVINEENQDFLDTISEMVNNFDKQSTQQPNNQKI